MRFAKLICPLLLIFLVAACNPGVHKIPIPQDTDLPPLDREISGKNPAIAFEAAVVNIRRGTLVGAYYAGTTEDGMRFCNYPGGSEMSWAEGKTVIANHDTDLGEIFHGVMSDMGYNTVGDPSIMFDRQKEIAKARYRIAARIVDMKANICREYSSWDTKALHVANGEVYLKVEWSIYDTRLRKRAALIETEGFNKQLKGHPDGFYIVFAKAFEDACADLGNSPVFFDTVNRVIDPNYKLDKDTYLCLDGKAKNSFQYGVEKYKRSVVTIRTGGGHGSGFVIAKDGHILTNAHVVGDNEEVMVRFAQGIEVPGKVLKVNPVKDVALIKCDIIATPVELAHELPKIAEELWAVGTPKDLSLNQTVTKGIVSGFRDSANDIERPLIQVDISINPGNSGGPVFNKKGKVVGISTQGYMVGEEHNRGNIGINFLLPIQNALDDIGINNTCTGK